MAMKRLQIGIMGDEGTEVTAEKLGAICSRRGANILVLSDKVGEAAAAGSLKAERVLCFNFGERGKNDAFSEMSVRCASELEAMSKIVDSSDGVVAVISGDIEGENAKIASAMAGKAKKPLVKVIRPGEASDAIGTLMEKIIFQGKK